ncbi:MAG: hypothetical protein M0R46_18075 [Candidatus Muirbacterium halophilum]|nr:hypothetical protein [Candidatus Muirbacterium halophilum]
MNRKSFFRKLGKLLDTKVGFIDDVEEGFSLNVAFKVSLTTDEIVSLKSRKVLVPITSVKEEAEEFFIDCLCDDFRKIAKKYHPELVSFLHEVGHIHTMKGIKYRWHQLKIAEIEQSNLCSLLYRELPREKLADEWAINWLINNKCLAKRLSDKMYKFNI